MADIIFTYTADDAMRDGYLFDVTEMAKQAGFIIPVRITIGVKNLVTPSKEAKQHGQSYEGRLWDVLWMACLAVRRAKDDTLTEFHVLFQDKPGTQIKEKLWAALDRTSGLAVHIFLPSEY